MNRRLLLPFICLTLFLMSCHSTKKTTVVYAGKTDAEIESRVKLKNKIPAVKIVVGRTKPDDLIEFAETLIGTPYRYGSCKPENGGLDCSGFVYYVFGHFGVKVPRVSKDYTNCGKEVEIKDCRKGDIILFTGSDANSGEVGHMGFVYEYKNGRLKFIHAASGGNKGVTVSGMSSYYVTRFVKINRVF